MTRYVALLRAINVGGRVVKMDRLRGLFEQLPLSNVSTFIASGNVLFDASARSVAALERKIETHLEQALGYEVGTYVRSAAEIAAVAAHEPFPRAELDQHTLYIGFHDSEPDAEAMKRLALLRTPDDEFHILGRELYWLRRGKISDSRLTGPVMAKALGVVGTTRNATTVRKLAALMK
jgi:uncharacterized protein (DUF1697 family)